jgi:hypothetical protein
MTQIDHHPLQTRETQDQLLTALSCKTKLWYAEGSCMLRYR